MGATVTVEKKVGVLSCKGVNYYALYEKTYSRNDWPRTPEWCCCAFGTIDVAMKFIFLAASSCESGMLRSRSGDLNPLNYVKSWMSLLKNPILLKNFEANLRGRYGHDEEKKKKISEELKAFGLDGVAKEFDSTGGASILLDEHADFFVSLLKNGFFAYNFLPREIYENITCPDLGYHPKPKTIPPYKAPQLLFTGDKFYLVKEAGEWKSAGWAYAILSSFIASHWDFEIKHPGSFQVYLKELRGSIDSAKMVPKNTIVKFLKEEDFIAYEKLEGAENFQLPITSITDNSLLYLTFSCRDVVFIVEDDYFDHACEAFDQMHLFA